MVHGKKQPVFIILKLLNPYTKPQKFQVFGYTEQEVRNSAANRMALIQVSEIWIESEVCGANEYVTDMELIFG